MFESLTDKFSTTLKNLSGKGAISESNVREAMREVRTSLLEADVHYDVVKDFCDTVTEQAVGEKVLKALDPGEQMVGIVRDELVRLMGPVDSHLMLIEPGPTIVMMSGLQGSGKTTTCGKLAAYLKKKGKKTMLAAADLQRPAAVEQLRTLTEQVNTEVEGDGSVLFHGEPEKCAEYGKAVGVAVTVCRNALKQARAEKCDVLILDTAGRLHINDDLMGELRDVAKALNPHQIYLVIDAMTGQDAVNSAKAFNEQLELDGVVLTKTDSDTRGGAALSVKQVTGKPIKFVGTSEKLDGLEEFHPDRMASRILGMGDILSLVEKAQEQVSEEEAEKLQQKMMEGKMTMDDFLKQLKSLRKMGSMKSLMGMLPGIGSQLKDVDIDDRELDRTEAIILSMTKEERKHVDIINHPRRRRIASGAGRQVNEVSQLIKGFDMVSNMTKQMSNMGGLQKLRGMAGGGGMFGGNANTGNAFKTKQRSKRKVNKRKRKSR